MAFIDANRDEVVEGRKLGVERICTVLQMPPSAYYAAKARQPSARARRDQELIAVLVRLWKDNYRVYAAGSCGSPPDGPVTTSAETRSLG